MAYKTERHGANHPRMRLGSALRPLIQTDRPPICFLKEQPFPLDYTKVIFASRHPLAFYSKPAANKAARVLALPAFVKAQGFLAASWRVWN